MTTPQIIRTAEELEALDGDCVLLTTQWPDPQPWISVEEDDVPAVAIASGDQVRAARKLLEKEDENNE